MNKVPPGAEQVVDLIGLPVSEAAARLVELAQAQGYTVAAVAPGTYRLARTRRRLLVDKRTESVVVTVFSDRIGTKARIVGPLDDLVVQEFARSADASRPQALAQVADIGRAAPSAPIGPPPNPQPGSMISVGPARLDVPPALAPRPVEPVAARCQPPASAPITSPTHPSSEIDDRTVTRASLSKSTTGAIVVLPDGRTVRLDRSLVVGRNPDPRMGAVGAVSVPVAEPSVSKTHAAIDLVDGVVWVTDLHSTNGTRIEIGGALTLCVPGKRTRVDTGGAILAGDIRIDVRGAP